MALRPLNDTVIIECDSQMIAEDTDQKVLDAVNSKLILLPDKNSVMKISNIGYVVSYGSKCYYKFKVGQKVIYDQFADTPVWIKIDGKTYRIIKYHYIKAVYE